MNHGMLMTLLLYMPLISVMAFSVYFDIFHKKIPNSIPVLLLAISGLFGLVLSLFTPVFFAKALAIFLVTGWMIFLRVFNPAYGKLFFACAVFSLLIQQEWVFLSDFFLIIFGYLLLRSIVFYLAFILRKASREAIIFHLRRKSSFITQQSLFQIGIFICIIIISAYVYPLVRYVLAPASLWLSAYLGVFDQSILHLPLFSVVLYLCMRSLYFLFSKYRKIHPIWVAILMISGIFAIEEYLQTPITREAIVGTLSIMGLFIAVKIFISWYIRISQRELMNYTKLLPGMTIDVQFLQDRFSLDIWEKEVLGASEVEEIRKSLEKKLADNPSLGQDVMVIRNFPLAPFIFSAFCLSLLQINIAGMIASVLISP